MTEIPGVVKFCVYLVLVLLAGGSVVTTLEALNKVEKLSEMIQRIAVGLLLLVIALAGIILLSYNLHA